MKKTIRNLVLVLLLTIAIASCAGVTTVANDISGFLTSTAVPDTCNLASYYKSYIEGAASLITSIPGFPPVGTLILSDLNTAENTLNSACQSGALLSTVTTDVADITTLITQYNSLAGQYAKVANISIPSLDTMTK